VLGGLLFFSFSTTHSPLGSGKAIDGIVELLVFGHCFMKILVGRRETRGVAQLRARFCGDAAKSGLRKWKYREDGHFGAIERGGDLA
jgi:hypothetical protein